MRPQDGILSEVGTLQRRTVLFQGRIVTLAQDGAAGENDQSLLSVRSPDWWTVGNEDKHEIGAGLRGGCVSHEVGTLETRWRVHEREGLVRP